MPSALIVGHSQAGSGATGQALETKLKSEGYTVERHSQHGATTQQIASIVDGLSKKTFDLAVVFCNTLNTKAVDSIVQNLANCKQILWYGAPPATLITNVSLAKTVFSSAVSGPNYWFTSGMATSREKDNVAVRDYLLSRKDGAYSKVFYVDWRKLVWDAPVLQPNGVMFPSLADGIHVSGSFAKQAVSAANWPPRSASSGSGGWDWRWVVAGAGAVYLAILVWKARKTGGSIRS